MNNNTILRIKVPAHLYESVKEQLNLKNTINEDTSLDLFNSIKNRYGKKYQIADRKGMILVAPKKATSGFIGRLVAGVVEPQGKKVMVAATNMTIDSQNTLNIQGEKMFKASDIDGIFNYLDTVMKAVDRSYNALYETKKSGKSFGDWTVVKEKKTSDSGSKKETKKTPEKVEEADDVDQQDRFADLGGNGIFPIIKFLLDDGFDIEDIIEKIKSHFSEEKTDSDEELEEGVQDLKEYEVIYVYENGQCYRKDDEGNKTKVDRSKCR